MIDNNLQQINSFTEGMDLDTGDQYLSEKSYREAYNLRVTNDTTGNMGSLHNIEGVEFQQDISIYLPLDKNGSAYSNVKVVHTDSIRRYGVVFVKGSSGPTEYYFIFRFINKDELLAGENGNPKMIFGPCDTYLGDNISSVTKHEDRDNIKLYYADQVNPLRSINISPEVDGSRPMTDDGSFSIYPTALMSKPVFQGFGSGNLKVGAYQYGYQLFNKNGAETEVSPLTEMIYTTPSSALPSTSSEVKGGLKDENSGKSIQLNIPINDDKYDRIKIISIFHEDTTGQPLIQVVKDAAIGARDGMVQYMAIDNTGISVMTVEEFNLVTSIHFVPSVLESKNNYLFASDIQYQDNVFDPDYDARAYSYAFNSSDVPIAAFKSADSDEVVTRSMADILNKTVVVGSDEDCINPYSIVNQNASTFVNKAQSSSFNFNTLKCAYRYDEESKSYIYGGQGLNVGYSLIVSELQEFPETSRSFEGVWYSNVTKDGSNVNVKFNKLVNSRRVTTCNYSNPVISSALKTLRRDEVYRYGIVFYNKFNQASPVKWIADIRIPSIYDLGFESFRSDAYTSFLEDKTDLRNSNLVIRPIGLKFDVKNLPEAVTSYEIVRCKRNESDRATITQGIIGCVNNPPKGTPFSLSQPESDNASSNRVFPGQLMMTTKGYFSEDNKSQPAYSLDSDIGLGHQTIKKDMFGDWTGSNWIFKRMTENVVNFTSPEICYNYERLKDSIPNTGIESQMVKFLFPWQSGEPQTPSGGSDFDGGKIKVLKYKHLPPMGSSEMVEARQYQPYIYRQKDQAYNIRLWNQSNTCTAIPSLQNGYDHIVTTSAGAHKEIDGIEFPKESSWKDYQNRADFLTGISSYIYDNWACEIVDQNQQIVSAQGPHGRSIIMSGGNPIGYQGLTFGIHPGRSIVSTQKLKSTLFSDRVMPQVSYQNNTGWYNQSIIGTALCNLRKKTVPYGGYGHSDRQFNTYISIGGFNTSDQQSTVSFSGDSFINQFLYVNTHYFKGMNQDGAASNEQDRFVGYSIPVESSVNLAHKSGAQMNQYSQIEPANINGKLIQDKPLYVYNSVYSVEPSARLFTPQSLYDEFNKRVDVRTHYSLSKSNDEFVDQWAKFKPLNYIDVDTRYGAITNLRTFGNELIYWQENAVGRFSVNERTLITDDSNSPLMLGTGGVLSRYDYLATANGLKLGHKDSDCQSDTVLYWYDYDKHELCAYAGGQVICLSKHKRVQSYLNRLDLLKDVQADKPMLTFDKNYNEVISTLSRTESLVYNEALQMFTGFYTLVPDYNLYFNSNVYFIKDSKLYLYGGNVRNMGFEQSQLPIELNYVVNKDYLRTKVYDNIEFTGYLQKSQIGFEFKADDIKAKPLLGSGITDRENNFRGAVPRVETSDLFGNRMRGRVMYCKMKYNLLTTDGINIVTIKNEEYLQTIEEADYIIANNVDGGVGANKRFELPYIRTTYRISRS